MKTNSFPFVPVLLAVALASTRVALSETLTLQVDSEKSSIELSGFVEISGLTVPLIPQGPNSLIAKYAGTIPVDVSGSAIKFLGGANVRALEPNDWQPGVGGAAGSAKASYAAKASALGGLEKAVAASRNLVLDATSANLQLASGQFPGGGIDFKFVDTANTTLDFNATGIVLAQGTKILSGLLTNQVASSGTFEGAVGSETLTVPINAAFKFEAVSSDGKTKVKFQIAFKGQLVAKRGGVVDDPVVVIAPPADNGGSISLNWSKSYKLQRATSLAPVNWMDVNADSPITIPPIQPGEFFRVVKK